MRADALGFFWEDKPAVKQAKAAPPKRKPPERTWEQPGYLPGLAEALKFDCQLFTVDELVAARGSKLVFDIESYPNYFLISFMCPVTKKILYFECEGDNSLPADGWLEWVVNNFTIVGFNSMKYDLPMTALALGGLTAQQLNGASFEIVVNGTQPHHVLRSYRVKGLRVDHIDLMEVAPLFASLKIYGGRMHAPRMQDLPFRPQTWLTFEQIAIVRWYNVNDLTTTILLYENLKEQIELRVSLSTEYGRDVRSKSDAQIAEAVISAELERISGQRPQQPEIPPGTVYRYQVPHFIKYQTPLMNWCLDVVRNAQFIVTEEGNVGMPPVLKELKIKIGNATYQMGIGGLHSTEETVAHHAKGCKLVDRDVTSYYPMIILLLGLYPQHLGPAFLQVYKKLVDRRIQAKLDGLKVIADSLKITVNGSFGKLGSMYSVLYAPDLLIQVTVTGQLSLLMLIERLELNGIAVVSGNTDGIVIKCLDGMEPLMDSIVKQWELDTGFQTEATEYLSLYSRDVNNYVAVKKKFDKTTKTYKNEPDGTKTKGAYAKPGLSKNPTGTICVEAVEALLTKRVPIQETIRNCQDIRKFVHVRKVKGGAVKNGDYLGVSIRWYYAAGEDGEIIYADSGKKVPKSEGAKPLMDLPKEFPQDINYDWYVNETEKMLKAIDYV